MRGFEVAMYEMPKFKSNVNKLLEAGTIEIEGLINCLAKQNKNIK